MTLRRLSATVGVALVLAASAGPKTSAGPSGTRPAARRSDKPAPKAAAPFSLVDAEGRRRALSDYRGRPVALFFFCGCPWCSRCARDWGQFQRGGVLPAKGGQPPETLVVFSGDAAAARDFALSTGLNPAQTVLLPDTAMHVTLDLYRAEPCPRVFVLDPQGRERYTNDHKDDAPRQAPEMVIASRALDALRAIAPAATRPAPVKGP